MALNSDAKGAEVLLLSVRGCEPVYQGAALGE
jgi:hypothetical protein